MTAKLKHVDPWRSIIPALFICFSCSNSTRKRGVCDTAEIQIPWQTPWYRVNNNTASNVSLLHQLWVCKQSLQLLLNGQLADREEIFAEFDKNMFIVLESHTPPLTAHSCTSTSSSRAAKIWPLFNKLRIRIDGRGTIFRVSKYLELYTKMNSCSCQTAPTNPNGPITIWYTEWLSLHVCVYDNKVYLILLILVLNWMR